jgi:WD40 repeat protein
MKLSGRDKRLIPIVVVVVLVLSLLVFYPSRQADDRHEPSAWGIALELLSLWMSPTIPEEQTPPPATGEVRTVPFSWSDRALSAWHELTTFEPVVAIIRQDVNAQTGAISPDGQYVATGGSTLRDVALSSVAEKRIVRKFAIDHGNIRAVAFSPDGKSLATGRGFMGNIPHNESVNIWDAQSGSLIRNLPGPAVSGTMRNDVTALAFNPDSRYLAVSYSLQPDRGNSIYLFDVESGERVRVMQPSSSAFGQLVFFDGGKRLACMDYSFEYDVFDVETGKRMQNISDPAQYALSPDGKYLAKATSKDNTLRIIERVTGREVKVLGTTKGLYLFAYSPDGRHLADWGLDGLRIWDVTSGKVVATLTAQPDYVSHWIGFDPGGKYFAAVCGWYVVVWDFQKLISAGYAN